MSYEVPSNIERDIERFAEEEHISASEAIERLILAGLRARPEKESPAQRLMGLFANEEDARLIYEAMAIAQEGRRSGSTRNLGE